MSLYGKDLAKNILIEGELKRRDYRVASLYDKVFNMRNPNIPPPLPPKPVIRHNVEFLPKFEPIGSQYFGGKQPAEPVVPSSPIDLENLARQIKRQSIEAEQQRATAIESLRRTKPIRVLEKMKLRSARNSKNQPNFEPELQRATDLGKKRRGLSISKRRQTTDQDIEKQIDPLNQQNLTELRERIRKLGTDVNQTL